MNKGMLVLFVLISNILFCQDEIILRKTCKKIWFELKITRVTADSITYISKKTISSLPVKEVIAYRKDYEQESAYIFPNPADKEKFEIKNSRAIDDEAAAYKIKDLYLMDIELLLRPYLRGDSYSEADLINNNLVVVKKINSRSIKVRKHTKLYIILKNDLNVSAGNKNRIPMKKYKFTTDSMLYFMHRYKKETSFYAVKFSDIQYIGVQTPAMIVCKTAIGLVQLSLTPFTTYLSINTFFHPMYKRLKMYNKWEIKVSEQPLSK